MQFGEKVSRSPGKYISFIQTDYFMKTLIVLFFFVCFCSLKSIGQEKFQSQLSGKASVPLSKLYLKYQMDDVLQIDSVIVRNNRFAINKELPYPVEALISTDKLHPPINVFLENGAYIFAIRKDSIILNKAPRTQALYEPFVKLNRSLSQLFPLYGKLSQEKDTLGLKRLAVQFDSMNTRTAALAKNIFNSHHQSPLSLFLFEKFAATNLDYSENEPYFLLLPDWAKTSTRGKAIAEIIEGSKRTKIGMQAPPFEQMDTIGRAVSLTSFTGKYLLVDFWASWCKPCREENPNLVRAYKQFKDKGLEILGVSLEYKGDKTKWIKAIQKDNLTWTHVSGLAFFEEPAARLYGVQSIPQNFLIDPSGKIIAKNLKGADLFKKLTEVLSK